MYVCMYKYINMYVCEIVNECEVMRPKEWERKGSRSWIGKLGLKNV